MYRPDEMAMILEQAKQYTNSQRVAFSEIKDVAIIPEQTVEIAMNEDIGLICAAVSTFVPTENEKIKVVWDGVEYNCSSGDGFFGNTSILGEGEDTGEPFVYLVSEDVGYIFCAEEGTYTISVSVRKNVVAKQLDFKYLPTIDLDYFITFNEGEEVLPDNIHKQMIECCKLGLPICLRMLGSRGRRSVVLSGGGDEQDGYFYGGINIYDFNGSGFWADVYLIKVNKYVATIRGLRRLIGATTGL